jgi:hypothetical protein
MDLVFDSTAERMRRDRRISVRSLDAEVRGWINARSRDEN